MSVLTTLQEWFEPMLDWLDKYGQWIAIKGIYAWEWLVLPVAAFLFLLWPFNRWWRRLMYALGCVLLVYLLCFKMHWYSYLAWPLMAGTLAYLFSRILWSRVIGFRPLWRERWNQTMQFARHGERRWRVAAVLAGTLLMIWFFRIPTESLLVLSGVLLSGGCLAWLLSRFRGGKQGLINYIGCDPRMIRYLDCVRLIQAPWRTRMTSLLAQNRLVGSSGSNALDSYADTATVKPRFGFWTALFRLACLPGVLQILRFLATRRRMPTLDSHFVAEQLAYEREKAWAKYERARFGETLDEYLKKTRRDDPAVANKPHVLQPLPAELNGDDARPLRLKWLAMTEAVAECHSFSDPTPINGSPRSRLVRAALWIRDRLIRVKNFVLRTILSVKNFVLHTILRVFFGPVTAAASPDTAASPEEGQPDLRLTAGLLSEAGELQHEIFWDLYRGAAEQVQAGVSGEPARRELTRLQSQQAEELRLGIHFFDLSTRCLELSLEPGLRADSAGAADLDIPRRAEQFCEVLGSQDWWSTRHSTDAGWSEIFLRLALFWRYLLLARLRVGCNKLERELRDPSAARERSPSGQDEPTPALQNWLAGPAQRLKQQIGVMLSQHPVPKPTRPAPASQAATIVEPDAISKRAAVAERAVIHATAYASLMLNLRRSDQARVMFGHTAFLLHEGRNNRAQTDKLAYTEELLDAIKDRADSRRVSMLWGLAVEQEMDFARPASDVWWEHCCQAIAFYRRSRSLRIWRLCALASSGPRNEGAVSTAALESRSPAARRSPAEIVELV